MNENFKKNIDDLVWWIPFRKLRDSVRNAYYDLYGSIENIKNGNDLILQKLESLENMKLVSTKPILSDLERELFLNVIGTSKNYLEFGAGGSTFLVLKKTNAKVFSVEGDLNWINYMRNNYFIYEQELLCRLRFLHVYIGEIRDTSYPIDDSEYYKYPNYSAQIFKELDGETLNSIDTVFIDGRFRVACALNLRNDVSVIIHDFFNRDYYHSLLDYIHCVDKADTLGVFKIKENVDKNKIKESIEKYKYDLR